MNHELLKGSHLFTAFPYIPPNPLLPPVWSRCTVIPLLLHPHAHLLSVSHRAKDSFLFKITMWSHVLALVLLNILYPEFVLHKYSQYYNNGL